MSEPFTSIPQPPPAPPGRPSTRAILALVLALCGFSGCGSWLAPFAWYLGTVERRAIAAGQAPPEGAQIAYLAKILGMIGTILLACFVFWIFFMGGMIVLQALLNHSS
jgi:hypothetical protein